MTRKTANKAKADTQAQGSGAVGLSRAEWVASAIATAAMNPEGGKHGGGKQRSKSSKADD